MADKRIRPDLTQVLQSQMLTVASSLARWVVTTIAPPADADPVAHVVDGALRPGYHFAKADEAVVHGHGFCDSESHGSVYAEVMRDVKADFRNPDEYQASCHQSRWSTNRVPRSFRICKTPRRTAHAGLLAGNDGKETRCCVDR